LGGGLGFLPQTDFVAGVREVSAYERARSWDESSFQRLLEKRPLNWYQEQLAVGASFPDAVQLDRRALPRSLSLGRSN